MKMDFIFIEVIKKNKKNENELYDTNTENKQNFVKRKNFEKEENFNFTDGMIVEASIRNVHKVHGTFVSVNNFIGIMKKSETSKDFVEDIDRFLMGKKTLKGILYNVNQDERSFMFSVRKFEAMDEKENSDNVKRLKIDEKNNLNKITYENVEDFKKSIEKIESIDKQKQIIENEINRLTDIKREEMCNFILILL
ncbi:hypothetical protein GVAV_003405 [Gurleya vavrai]